MFLKKNATNIPITNINILSVKVDSNGAEGDKFLVAGRLYYSMF